MRVENQTSNPVEYEQTGSGPTQDEVAGRLEPGESRDFTPSGKAPFQVTFKAPPGAEKPDKAAEAGAIATPDATIVLTGFPVVVEVLVG